MGFVAEFLLGLGDPMQPNKTCRKFLFALNLIMYAADCVDAVAVGSYSIGYLNIYGLPVYSRLVLTTLFTWPTVFSGLKILMEYLTERPTKRHRREWKCARRQLVKLDSVKIRPAKCITQSADTGTSAISSLSRTERFLAVLSKIHPTDFFLSCASYISLCWAADENTGHLDTYHNDIAYCQRTIQRSQLVKIKYYAFPRLLTIIVLTAFDTNTVSRLNPLVFLSVVFSILSITFYFCLMARLPRQIVFNHQVLTKKDSLHEDEIHTLLQPWIFPIRDLFLNAFYLGSCYGVMLLLVLLSWERFVLTVGIQVFIVGVALTYCRCSPATRSRTGPCEFIGAVPAQSNGNNLSQCGNFRGRLRAVAGHVWDFTSNIWTTCGYLIAPASLTAFTSRGNVVGASLRVIPLVVYVLEVYTRSALPVNDTDHFVNGIQNDTTDVPTTLQDSSAFIPTIVHVLLLIFGVLDLLLHVLLGWLNRSNLFLFEKLSYDHRRKSRTSIDIIKKYRNHRPCWFCEMSWCASQSDSVQFSTGLVGPSGELPSVPYIPNREAKSVPLSASEILITLFLANIGSSCDTDFLLCQSHATIVRELRRPRVSPPRQQVTMGKVQLYFERTTGLLYPSHIGAHASVESMCRNARSFDLTADLHGFLRYLYSPNLLGKQMPHQLLYKAFFYDKGIQDPVMQDSYWRRVKRTREEHEDCGENCKFNIDGCLIEPEGNAPEPFRMDLEQDAAKIQEFMTFFNQERVLLLDEAVMGYKTTKKDHGIQNDSSHNKSFFSNFCSLFSKKRDSKNRDYTVQYDQITQKTKHVD